MSKILMRHLERRASIYVRQSSIAQVENHRERGQRQYNPQGRVVTLITRSRSLVAYPEYR